VPADPDAVSDVPIEFSHVAADGGSTTTTGVIDMGPMVRGRLYARGSEGKGHVTVVPVGDALCLLVLRGGVLFPSSTDAADATCGRDEARHRDPMAGQGELPEPSPATGAVENAGGPPMDPSDPPVDAAYSPRESSAAPDMGVVAPEPKTPPAAAVAAPATATPTPTRPSAPPLPPTSQQPPVTLPVLGAAGRRRIAREIMDPPPLRPPGAGAGGPFVSLSSLDRANGRQMSLETGSLFARWFGCCVATSAADDPRGPRIRPAAPPS
jgi:hypothetical protein